MRRIERSFYYLSASGASSIINCFLPRITVFFICRERKQKTFSFVLHSCSWQLCIETKLTKMSFRHLPQYKFTYYSYSYPIEVTATPTVTFKSDAAQWIDDEISTSRCNGWEILFVGNQHCRFGNADVNRWFAVTKNRTPQEYVNANKPFRLDAKCEDVCDWYRSGTVSSRFLRTLEIFLLQWIDQNYGWKNYSRSNTLGAAIHFFHLLLVRPAEWKEYQAMQRRHSNKIQTSLCRRLDGLAGHKTHQFLLSFPQISDHFCEFRYNGVKRLPVASHTRRHEP